MFLAALLFVSWLLHIVALWTICLFVARVFSFGNCFRCGVTLIDCLSACGIFGDALNNMCVVLADACGFVGICY